MLEHCSFISTQTHHTVGSEYIAEKGKERFDQPVKLFFFFLVDSPHNYSFNLHHNIHRVTLNASFFEVLHVALNKRDVGLLIAKPLSMILNVLTSCCDLKGYELIRKGTDIKVPSLQMSVITRSSVISSPVTCPFGPTSLLKA